MGLHGKRKRLILILYFPLIVRRFGNAVEVTDLLRRQILRTAHLHPLVISAAIFPVNPPNAQNIFATLQSMKVE